MKKGFLGMLALTLIFGMAVIGCGGDENGTGDGNDGETYSVTIGTLTNANGCTITANPKSGKEGTEITLTIKEINGYSLKSGTLKYGTANINGTTRKFNLPAKNVSITAEFELIIPESNVPVYHYQTLEQGSFSDNVRMWPTGGGNYYTIGTITNGFMTLQLPVDESFKTWVSEYFKDSIDNIYVQPSTAKFYFGNFGIENQAGGLGYGNNDIGIAYIYFTESAILKGTAEGLFVDIIAQAGWNRVYYSWSETEEVIKSDTSNLPNNLKWEYGRK